ncbi:exonuclease SbcCD subunit D [Candidatus Dependentiae bacterium]|nr:exonuclease SbcCD subunit D [Candidatus Dependentiae bacterium]
MIRFFHVADVHFGVENYGKLDQKTGIHSRFLDFVQSFEHCVDQAIDESVDFFLFCGDAYKTAYPTPTQQKQFLRLLFKLQQAAIPVITVVGNHDHPLSFGKTHALDVFSTVPLNGLHVFSKPDILKIKTRSGEVQVVGIAWPLRHNLITKNEHRFKDAQEIAKYISEKVGAIITSLAEKLDPKIPSVLAGHLTVANGLFSGSERRAVFGNDPIFLPSQLAIQPFDYVALGHLHRYQNLNPNGYPAVVYSGSVERIDFGERKEKKGFCSVQIDLSKDSNRCVHTFVELPTRPMIQIEAALEVGKSQTQQVVKAIQKQKLDGAIVKVLYHLPEGVDDKVDLFEVQRACSEALCIASINPIRKQIKHERRIGLTVSMDCMKVVNKYIDSKDDLGVETKSLKSKAFELYHELEGDT